MCVCLISKFSVKNCKLFVAYVFAVRLKGIQNVNIFTDMVIVNDQHLWLILVRFFLTVTYS